MFEKMFENVSVQMFEKCDSSNIQQKWMVASFTNFTAKFGIVFVTGKHFFLEVYFQANRKSISSSKNRY